MTTKVTQAQEPEQPVVDDLAPLSSEDEAVLNEEIAKEASDTKPINLIGGSAIGLPSIKQMRALLERPIPQRLLKTMKNYGGTGTITYLHWTTVKKFLDLRSPGWEYYITHIVPTEIGVAVAVKLVIPCSDGNIISGGIGFEAHRQGAKNNPTGFGGAAVVAERQALKRASSLAGLGFALYQG